jgi:hypothetical protein
MMSSSMFWIEFCLLQNSVSRPNVPLEPCRYGLCLGVGEFLSANSHLTLQYGDGHFSAGTGTTFRGRLRWRVLLLLTHESTGDRRYPEQVVNPGAFRGIDPRKVALVRAQAPTTVHGALARTGATLCVNHTLKRDSLIRGVNLIASQW